MGDEVLRLMTYDKDPLGQRLLNPISNSNMNPRVNRTTGVRPSQPVLWIILCHEANHHASKRYFD